MSVDRLFSVCSIVYLFVYLLCWCFIVCLCEFPSSIACFRWFAFFACAILLFVCLRAVCFVALLFRLFVRVFDLLIYCFTALSF